MKNIKTIIVLILVLFSFNLYSQHKKSDFFGKWKITRIVDSKVENKENNEEKLGLKALIDKKIKNEGYYIILTKKKIQFVQDNVVLEELNIKSLSLKGNCLELTFENYKKHIILKSKSEAELIGDGTTHYLNK